LIDRQPPRNYNAVHLSRAANYYEILGANEDASSRDIGRLYKRAAHKLHPDRGGAEEDMKALNEAYSVLRNEKTRREYDARQRVPRAYAVPMPSTPAAREVGFYGQLLSALMCLALGLLLLLLVHFNGLWFLWPLSILAAGVIMFGVMIAHSAMTNARESTRTDHPLRRLRAAQEVVFWLVVAAGGFGIYLIMTSV
jgi:curved DNA-binding protein CbpA